MCFIKKLVICTKPAVPKVCTATLQGRRATESKAPWDQTQFQKGAVRRKSLGTAVLSNIIFIDFIVYNYNFIMKTCIIKNVFFILTYHFH